MINVKNDEYYIKKIKEQIEFINKHMTNISIKEFYNDEVLQDSMLFRLTQVYEYSKGLSEEYKERIDIPWNLLSGMRNRIVHNYGNVDLEIVYDTLTISIPNLNNYFN